MAHELSAGSVFAGYRIERMLGAGGMGTVYRARNPDLPRSEALKVLAAELSRDLDFRARFVREADVAAGLDHPNIVAVHQRGQFEGRLCTNRGPRRRQALQPFLPPRPAQHHRNHRS